MFIFFHDINSAYKFSMITTGHLNRLDPSQLQQGDITRQDNLS